jgi:hypothetical protein
MAGKRKRKVIIVGNDSYLQDAPNFKKGFEQLKTKDTLKQIGKLALGSLAGNVAVILTNKLASGSTNTLQYALGTASSGLITIAALGMGERDMGYGAAMVATQQGINAASCLITGKSLGQHISN